MNNYDHKRLSIFDFDEEIRAAVRQNPSLLLREGFSPVEVVQQGILQRLDLSVETGSFIGAWKPIDTPKVVVTGICQGRCRKEDKEMWIQLGPSVETVVALDTAQRVASSIPNCRLQIWIVDQEYSNIVCDTERFTSLPATEIQLGNTLYNWCKERFPGAEIYKTSDSAVRGALYTLLSDGSLSRLYPEGVDSPYGSSGRVFWQEMQYLVSVAAFSYSAARDCESVLVIADHDQLRAMAAARACFGSKVGALALWPCPRLSWKSPKWRTDGVKGYVERFLAAVKKENRRMYRADSPSEMLFAGMNKERIYDRLTADDVDTSTIREFLGLVLPSEWSQYGTRESMAEAVSHAIACFAQSGR